MKVYSPVFSDKAQIPIKYVMPMAGGQNISPPIFWENIPKETQSLVLLCVDTHPVAKNWIHWIVINIPPNIKGFNEGASLKEIKPPAQELMNSYGFKGWGGPQPPPGTGLHSYVFKVLALNTSEIKFPTKPKYEEILKAVKPYLLGEGNLTVYFGR